MATLAPCFSMKKCPPGIAHGADRPEVQFADRKKNPVHADFGADGEISSTGIAFEDYSRCQVRIRKMSGERRLPTPSWAFDYAQQRELLARFWEQRAGIMFPRIDTPATPLCVSAIHAGQGSQPEAVVGKALP